LEFGHECVGFSEVDKYAITVYSRHFPSHVNYGDITKIAAASLPDFDLLCGGFPCQAFSIAGKRHGFADTRGTLFFDLARILQAKQPRYCLFENVKGLLSHSDGRTFKTIIAALDELGYDVQWQVLNSRHFGVPQNRERVFIVGHLRGTPRPEVFPLEEGRRSDSSGLNWESDDGGLNVHGQEGQNVRNPRSVIGASIRGRNSQPTLELRKDDVAGALRSAEGGSSKGMVLIRAKALHVPEGFPGSYQAETDGIAVVERLTRTRSILRRLTPVECERLQGFPDNWTAGISDSQRYKCCGNALTVTVARAIVQQLCPVAIRPATIKTIQ
jgi:DNA (cytosine-5)-methyltransferase 1